MRHTDLVVRVAGVVLLQPVKQFREPEPQSIVPAHAVVSRVSRQSLDTKHGASTNMLAHDKLNC